MTPRQRRGVLLLFVAGIGAILVFSLVSGYVADVRKDVEPKTAVLVLTRAVPELQPIPPDAVALKNRLDKLQGATFDQAYMRAMSDDHVKAVREFEMAAKSTDPDIKAFAEKTLPTLREHLKMAQDSYKAVSSVRAGTSGAPATK